MNRVLAGICVGAVCGVLALASCGAYGGFVHGHEWGGALVRHLPPGEAAIIWAFVFVAYCWWLAGAVGGVIGGLAGLGSWLVRPRPPVKTSVSGQ
jgi:hypothetical protein